MENLRMIGRDAGLLSLLGIDAVPSTDAFGLWLRRSSGKEAAETRTGVRTSRPGRGPRS